MYHKILFNLLLLLNFVSVTFEDKLPKSRQVRNNVLSKSPVLKESDDGKSSLVFVFDTTGSMYDDLKQLRAGAEMILNTALKESNIIADFVFVPFHDPAVGPATVTRNKKVFKAALNIVKVHGGGDCPEQSLTGIQLALNVSRPRSFIYVFTDATASDHRLVGKVLDAVQRKQSQVVFVLTGHCNDLKKPTYTVYQQIAAASSGQIFNLNKTGVHQVLEFVKSSIKGRTVNLGSVVQQPAGTNYTQDIPVDSTVSEVTVSVSGAKPKITVVNPSGEQITGPPKLVTTLDLSEIMVVKVLEPEPGNWSITVGSEKDYSVKVVGLSNLTFNHGFSVELPKSMAETSYRPLQGTYNHMMLSVAKTEVPVQINYAEILNLNGNTLFEVPLKEFDKANNLYLTDAFVPPDEFFYIAINGRDEHNQEIRRVGATAVQTKLPDVPYLTSPSKVQVHSHARVMLKCSVESLVPVTAVWTKDRVRVQPEVSSLQTTSIEYVIEDMIEEHVGTYRCIAKNIAGVSRAITEVSLLVDPPQVTIQPTNSTVEIGELINIRCHVMSEALLLKNRLIFNGTNIQYVIDNSQEPNIEGVYTFSRTIKAANENDTGIYTCIAANRGGESNQTTHITIKSKPTALILGPHDITKPINSVLQLVCNIENAGIMQWIAPNGTVVKESRVDGNLDDVLEVSVAEDGVWQCIAWRGAFKGSDSVNVKVLIKPKVSIIGEKNVTVLNGTQHQVVCDVTGKPKPRIIWHKETEEFLDNIVTALSNNRFRSVLTINSSGSQIEATYFCVGENSEGIDQDGVVVNVRRPMTVVKKLDDISVPLYAETELSCQIDSHPPPLIEWYHNDTTLKYGNNIQISNDNTTIYIKRVDFDDLGVYSCIGKNAYEEVKLNGTLGVHGLEIPLISKDTKILVAKEGSSTTMTCRLTKGNPVSTIRWLYKNATMKDYETMNSSRVTIDDKEAKILNVTASDAGFYRCTAENVLGNDIFDMEFIVQYPPKLNISEKELKEHKKPREVKAGDRVQFSCEAVGEPKPIIVWTKDGFPMVYTKNLHLTEVNDLVIEKASEYDSGLFTCNATSSMGSTQWNFTLFIYVPPNITKTDLDPELELLEGQLVELPCPVQGVPRPEVEWRQNGELLSDTKKYADESGLRFVANLTDFGNYTCNVRNPYGNTSVTYSVYVWVAPFIEPPLENTKNVLIGNEVKLQCNVVGFPVPTVAWEVQGDVVIQNTTNISYDDLGNLYIKNVTIDNEGEYVCIAENLAGIAKKTTYLIINEAPRILEDNYTGPYLATNMDTSLTISCQAIGKPKPFVLWIKDEFYLNKDSRYDTDIEGTLIIKSPTEDMSGNYTCIAKNLYGTVNKTVEVRIYPLPTAIQSEEPQTKVVVLETTNTSVDCPIHASQSDTVKWYKDAKLVSTGTLQISNVSRDNCSLYACVVSNAVGSAHASVYLTVEWPPKFKENVTTILGAVKGEDVYYDCEVDAKPIAKIKWFRNAKQLVFEDKEHLKLINIQPHDAGIYKCVVSNIHGTVHREFNFNVMVPPFISEFDVLDVLLKEGVNASLECDAKGTPIPTIKWVYNNSLWHLDGSALSAANISTSSEGIYRCEATNKAGVAHMVYRVSVVSGAKIQEIVAYKNGEGINVDKAVEVVLGSHIRIACKASGKPHPSIQWIRNGVAISENTQDIDYADLTLENLELVHGGVYTCIVANEGGNDERRIKLDVLEPPKIFQTLFGNTNKSENTINLEVISGQAFYLHCHPYGNPLPEVYWFKDDLPLRIFDDTLVSMDYGEVISVNKATEDMSGNYTCVARNKVGNTSVVYLVDVLVPPPTPKESTKQITNRLGKPLILSCPVEGSPLPSVMWIKHPYVEITGEDPRMSLAEDGFALLINKSEVSDSGKYSCIMTNKVGTTEIVYDVTIEKPPSIAGNVGDKIIEGHVVPLRRSIVLKCEADGHPLPKISWLKDTQQLSDSLSNIQRVLGNSLLAIWSVKMRDAGQYICVVENSAGTAHRRYNIAVQVPGKWGSWSQWTFCNVTCGLGYQQRSRICQYTDEYNVSIDNTTQSDKVILDESACKGPSSDRRKCHMPPCEDTENQPKWSVWSRWSVCSASCGSGTQARTRRCKTKNKCLGDNVQLRKCPDLPKCKREEESPMEIDNNVYSSKEDIDSPNAYLPEVTYEMEPEIINSHYSPDVEEFYVASGSKQTTVYYDVEVTQNLDNSDKGSCDPGYRHNRTTNKCDDIDECLIEINKCHSTQVCINTEGAYRCSCSPGYVSLGAGQRCLDINECEQDIDGCEFACVNVAGGYVCACPKHLRLHIDKHHCVPPSLYRRPITHEESATEDYLTTVVDYPTRYTKNLRSP